MSAITNQELCEYHNKPLWEVIDGDPNTKVCDECFDHCKYYIKKDGVYYEVKP